MRRAEARPVWLGLVAALIIGLSVSGCGGPMVAGPSASPATGAPSPSGPLGLSVMTYNVLGGPIPDDWFVQIPRAEVGQLRRAPATIAKIVAANPDVIGIQEFVPQTASGDAIVAGLVDYQWLDGPGNHAIAVRKSRFEVLDSGFARLNTIGEADTYHDRYAFWVRLHDRTSGRNLVVVNVHALPHQTPQIAAARSLAIDRLVALIGQLNPGLREPLVVTGDFNAANVETRAVFADHLVKLKTLGLVDAGVVAKKDLSDVPGASSLNGMVATVNGAVVAKVVRRTNRHIDYVWVPKGTAVKTWSVVSGPGVAWRDVRGHRVPMWTGIVASDHSPVVATMTFG